MFVALLLETGAGLAPPYLLGQGDRRRHPDRRRLSALDLIVAAFVDHRDPLRGRTYAETYLVGWVGTRALQDLRERIFSHIQSMSIGFFTRRSPGVLISRMTNDVEALNQLVTSGVVTIFSSTLTLVGVVVILLFLDVQAGADHLPHLPAAGDRQRRLPDRLGRHLPGDPRADRRRHRLPAGDPQRRPRRPQLRPGAAPRRRDDRAERGRTATST